MFMSKEVKFYGLRNAVKKLGYSPLLIALLLSIALLALSFLGAWGFRAIVATDYINASELVNGVAYFLLFGTLAVAYLSVGIGMPVLYGIRLGWRQSVKVTVYQLLFLVIFIMVFANYFVHHVPPSTPFDGQLCGPNGLCKGL